MQTKTVGAQNPNSGSPGAGGQNGVTLAASGPLEKSTLAQALSLMAEPSAAETESATAPAQEPAAEPDAQAVEVQTEETQPETPVGESGAQEPAAEADGGTTDLSQTDTTLEAETQKHVKELARLMAEKKLNLGEIRRIENLIRKNTETKSEYEQKLESLTQEVERLKAQENETPVPSGNPLANRVKDETSLRKMKVELHEVLEFAEENPDGGTFRNQEFNADQVRQLRRDARRALDIWLPERAEQIVAQKQFRQVQSQARQTFIKDYPQYADPENPDTKRAREFLKDPFLTERFPNADYIAHAIAVGDRVLQEQRAKKTLVKPTTQATTPKVKPAAVATSSPPRQGGNNIQQLVDQVKKTGTRDDLVKLFAAGGG